MKKSQYFLNTGLKQNLKIFHPIKEHLVQIYRRKQLRLWTPAKVACAFENFLPGKICATLSFAICLIYLLEERRKNKRGAEVGGAHPPERYLSATGATTPTLPSFVQMNETFWESRMPCGF